MTALVGPLPGPLQLAPADSSDAARRPWRPDLRPPIRRYSGSTCQTARTYDRVLAAHCARGLHPLRPSLYRGRRESRVPIAPMGPVQRKHGSRTTGEPETSRLSLRDGFTVSFVLSPVTGLCCHRHPRFLKHELDSGVGEPGPHDFAVRAHLRSSSQAIRVHRIPPRVRDVRNAPLVG